MVKVYKAPEGTLAHLVEIGRNSFLVDEPPPAGEDRGPTPHDVLDAALAACTAMTVMLVARRKQWPLQDVRVEITRDEDDAVYRMSRRIELVGSLTDEQKQYLLGIADKCPIHRALHKKFEIDSRLV